MATQKDLRSDDVNKLGDIINALESVVEQMVESFTSLESQTTGMSDKVSTLQSDMSIGRTSLQTDLGILRELKESVDTYVSEIRDRKVGSTKNRQNEYLQNTLSTIESINESLESIESSLEAQNDDYDSQLNVIEIMQNKWVEERSIVDKNDKSIRRLIAEARDYILDTTAEGIVGEISKTRKALDKRIKWLWGFIGAVSIVAAIGIILGPTLSNWIVTKTGQDISNFGSWEYLLLSRISLPAILSAPYFLLKKSLDLTSEEARLYQHKGVMLETLIVFRGRLDEGDQTSKDETIKKMIEAISIPPSSKMSGETK